MTERVYTTDEIWPRIRDYRYRIVAVIPDGIDILGAAPDMEGVGLALQTWHEEAKAAGTTLSARGRIGILDVIENDWIVLPFDRGNHI